MPLLFVYGTLKRGDVRARELADQRFIGDALTLPAYRLFDCGDYPGLVEVDDNGVAVEGEVFDVAVDHLSRLDQVEGVHDGLYERRRVRLQSPFHERTVEAYFYRWNVAGLADCGPRWERRAGSRDEADATVSDLE